jgi:formamidopyrimidine-DNA glycosylase
MPELPEVETVCRGLAKTLEGRKIVNVTVRRRDLRVPLPKNFEQVLRGRKIHRITRRAKYILMHLDGGHVLIIHLGMSGSLVLYDKKPTHWRKHDHVIFEFSPFMLLAFHDPRRFGLMALGTEKTLEKNKLFTGLGPEPFDKKLGAVFYPLLHIAKAPVKSVIMDQQRIVGVGNIYACEALFASHIHPKRPANKVTAKEAALLLASIRKTLKEAIKSGGSTLRDYVRSSGDAGYFQHRFCVYGRKGEPCVTCKTPISVIRQSGRSTFFCPHCQK